MTPSKPPKAPAPGLSLSSYARRRGVALATVKRAIDRGRIRAGVVRDAAGRPWIDAEVADREWAAATDLTTAPPAVREQLERGGVVASAPSAPPPPSEGGDEYPGVGDPTSLSEQSAREKYWKANQAELEYRRRAAELVEASEVEAGWVSVVSAARSKMLAVPTRFKQQFPDLTDKHVAGLDALVREVLEAFASPRDE